MSKIFLRIVSTFLFKIFRAFSLDITTNFLESCTIFMLSALSLFEIKLSSPFRVFETLQLFESLVFFNKGTEEEVEEDEDEDEEEEEEEEEEEDEDEDEDEEEEEEEEDDEDEDEEVKR